MVRLVTFRLLPVIILISAAACSGTRHLQSGEKLYSGAEIKLKTVDKLTGREERKIKSAAKSALRPAPNKTFLGMRPKLSWYMAAGEHPHGAFKKWLKKNGEPPVLIDNVKPAATAEIIDAALFNSGIFRSSTQYNLVERKRTAKVVYTSSVHKPYVIRGIDYMVNDTAISRIITENRNKKLLKAGDTYDLTMLGLERSRIDDLLKNKGYFYFNPDNLIFKADTSEMEKKVSLTLNLKDSLPQNALTVYRIGNVSTDQRFSLTSSINGKQDSSSGEEGAGMIIRPRVLARAIHLREGDLYSRKNHTITLNRLMTMGTFKFANIRYSADDTSGYLNASVLMTPMPKHTFSTEIDLVSKSNDFAGPRMNLSYLEKNVFGGAELLKLNLAGSYEVQLGGQNLYSYTFNPQVELNFPRFVVPFEAGSSRMYTPKTRLLLSYNLLKRVSYFTMRTSRFIYGFNWKESIRKEHEFDPVTISYTSLRNRSDTFNLLLDANPYLKKSYEEQFIAGMSYTFTYNEQVVPDKKIQYYFQFASELAGNTVSLAKRIGGEKISDQNPSKLFGSIYSQFARFSADGRAYLNFPDKNKLALRIFGGVAAPYGNSSSLPYTRQFFSGGPNSVRAFHINSLGPGTVYQETGNQFLMEGGNIKAELNAEYRFGIIGFLKGAIFTDAGNVWLLKSNPANTGSPFSFSSFTRELGVGAGFGLRFDFSFVILRFDLAAPLRKPWLEENHRWVVDQINLGSSAWRRENLVLNIAIGQAF